MVENKIKICSGHALRICFGISLFALVLLAGAADAAPFAYIGASNGLNMSVIDTATNTIIATVTVGGACLGVAVNPAGTTVYETDNYNGKVYVFDSATNTVTATVPVIDAYGVAVNPAGTKVYVTSGSGHSVSVIDTATNTVTATVPVGSYPEGVAVTPDGTKVYVTNHNDNTVSVIDTATNTVTATVNLPNSAPTGIAVNPAGTKVYVADYYDDSVSVIDTATNQAITIPIPGGQGPYGVAVTPDGTKVYVTNDKFTASNTVSVIDTTTNKVTATVTVGMGPAGVAVTGTKVYVENVDGTVSVIDTATDTVTATVNVGAGAPGAVSGAIGLFIGSAGVTITGGTGGQQPPGVSSGPPPFGSTEPAPADHMTLQAFQRRVVSGSLVSVPVWLIKGSDVANMDFTISYDATVATPEGNLEKGYMLDNALFESNTGGTGIIRASFAQNSGVVNGTGPVAYLPFRAVGQPGTKTVLHLEVTTINNPAGDKLAIDRIDGSIEIISNGTQTAAEACGQAQFNENVAVCALQMSVRLKPVDLALDLNADGQVNSRDATIVLQRTAVAKVGG